jgi:hypothetical protein
MGWGEILFWGGGFWVFLLGEKRYFIIKLNK